MTSVRRPAPGLRLAAALLPLVLAGGVLAGCSNEADEPPSQNPTSQETTMDSGQPTPDPPQSPIPGANSQVVERSIADLAEREGVEESEITIVAVEEVTWSDGSLGCAKPGRMYTQALVEGQRITLRIGDQDFAYHAAAGKDATYCARPSQ